MPCCDSKSDSKKELLDRVARIEGHLKKVKEMIQDDAYCIDIITQSLAVQSALRSVDELVLKNHLQTCVKDAMVTNKGVDQKVDEVIKTLRFMRK